MLRISQTKSVSYHSSLYIIYSILSVSIDYKELSVRYCILSPCNKVRGTWAKLVDFNSFVFAVYVIPLLSTELN